MISIRNLDYMDGFLERREPVFASAVLVISRRGRSTGREHGQGCLLSHELVIKHYSFYREYDKSIRHASTY